MNELVSAIKRARDANFAASSELMERLMSCGFFAGGCYHSDYLDGYPTREECDAMLRLLTSLDRQRDAMRSVLRDHEVVESFKKPTAEHE